MSVRTREIRRAIAGRACAQLEPSKPAWEKTPSFQWRFCVPFFRHCCLLLFLKYRSKQPSKTRQPRYHSGSASSVSLCGSLERCCCVLVCFERACAFVYVMCILHQVVRTQRVGVMFALSLSLCHRAATAVSASAAHSYHNLRRHHAAAPEKLYYYGGP